MSTKIKTIEPCRFLNDDMLSNLQGGVCSLVDSCPSKHEACSSQQMFTTCKINYSMNCALYRITCGAQASFSFQSCANAPENFTSCSGSFDVIGTA